MLLNFYISSSSTPSKSSIMPADSADNWVDKTILRSQEKYTEVSEMTLEDIKDWSSRSLEQLKSSFRYLTGQPATPIPPATSQAPPAADHSPEKSGLLKKMFGGVFSVKLGGSSVDDTDPSLAVTWTEGEVHADLVKVSPVSARSVYC
jgi:hypothetical protein